MAEGKSTDGGPGEPESAVHSWMTMDKLCSQFQPCLPKCKMGKRK